MINLKNGDRKDSALGFNRLASALLELSEADDVRTAAGEWLPIGMNPIEEGTVCVCGRQGLESVFRIRNLRTGEEMGPIGSKCIDRFGNEGLSAETLNLNRAHELRRRFLLGDVIELNSTYFTKKLIGFFSKEGFLSGWDFQFAIQAFLRAGRHAWLSKSDQQRAEEVVKAIRKGLLATDKHGDDIPIWVDHSELDPVDGGKAAEARFHRANIARIEAQIGILTAMSTRDPLR